MKNMKDSPGVYIPPPLFYVLTFLAAVFLQKMEPIPIWFLRQPIAKITGVFFLLIALYFLLRSFAQFYRSKNTLITIKPAHSLQTDGLYRFTRNPMYVGLATVYLGLTFIIGNWWNIIFLPVLLLVVQEYIIKREERYLERRFGQDYLTYRSKVRRWI